MLHKFSKFTNLIILSLALFFAAGKTFAATQVYFSAPSGTAVGSIFSVKVLLDADRVANAYAATVAWGGPVQFVNANDANSIITIWQKSPAAGDGNTIHFEGGALAPFGGAGGQLLILNFKAIASGTARFSMADAGVYLADGRGTKITPDKKGVSVVIAGLAQASSTRSSSTVISGVRESGSAAVPPEIKFIDIISDPSANGQKLLSFLVSDAGSGVKASYVRYKIWLPWSAWQAVSNPAPLPGNAWAVGFRVEDNTGNLAELAVYDWPALWILIGESAIAAFVLMVAGMLVFRRRRL